MRSVPDADIAAAAAARNIKNKCRKRKNRCFCNGFFVILRDRAHSGTARFLYAGFGGNCLDRVLLGLALFHAAADCLSGRGKTFGLVLLGLRLVRRTLEDEHELATRRVGVKVGNRLVERHAERLLMQLGQLARE